VRILCRLTDFPFYYRLLETLVEKGECNQEPTKNEENDDPAIVS